MTSVFILMTRDDTSKQFKIDSVYSRRYAALQRLENVIKVTSDDTVRYVDEWVVHDLDPT